MASVDGEGLGRDSRSRASAATLARHLLGGLMRWVLGGVGVAAGVAFGIAGWQLRDANPTALVGLVAAAVMTAIVISATNLGQVKLTVLLSLVYVVVAVACAGFGSLAMIAAAVAVVSSATVVRLATL